MHLHCLAALGLALLTAAPGCAQQAAAGSGFVNTLMPLPSTVESKAGSLRITGSFSYALQGKGGALVSEGVVRLLNRLEMRTGVSLAKAPAAAGQDAVLTVDVATASSSAVPVLGEDESYTLDVDGQHGSLHAQTEIGALRGMETLLQLAQPAGDGFVFPAVHIADAPRFAWRGLMLDSGRHFLPVAVIYRTLDGMAAVKLNVLHWHLPRTRAFASRARSIPNCRGWAPTGFTTRRSRCGRL
jgi:hexosaminidase